MDEENKWFLREAVVNKNLCTYCGACAAVCPYDIIEFKDNGPDIKEKCFRNGEGACKEVCHRVMTDAARLSLNVFNFKSKPPKNPLGQYEKIVSARSSDETIREHAQDGGAVTALLTYMFDKGLIDGAATVSDVTKPASRVISSKEQLFDTTGAKYSTVPVLSALRSRDEELKRVALVGLPCQVYGARRAQFAKGLNAHPPERGTDGENANLPMFPYVIGLFCMENFDYDKLSTFLSEQGVDINSVTRFSIHLDEFTAHTKDGDRVFSLRDLSGCVWDGCRMCRDAVSKVADISAGHSGSSGGWTTLVIRNAKGLELYENALKEGYLEAKEDDVDICAVEDFANLKMKRFNRTLKKRMESDTPLNFYWVRDYPGVRPEVSGTNFVKVKSKSGIVDHDYLAKVTELAGKYGDGTLEFTTRKSIEIQGVPGENVDPIMKEIYENDIMTIGMGYAVACVGAAYCPEGLIYTKDIANKLTMMFAQRGMPHKLKVGVAGCPNSCVRVRNHDIGIMGQLKPKLDEEKCTGCGRCVELCKYYALSIVNGKSERDMDLCRNCGWCVRGCPHEAMVEDKRGCSLWIGGNDARRPTEAILLRSFIPEEEIPQVVDNVLKLIGKYVTQPGRQRLGNIIDQVGIGEFTKELNEM